MIDSPPLLRFLGRAARLFAEGEWIFTGFHWPVLAMATARLLRGDAFTAVFEAGAAVSSSEFMLPTSTTDFAAYGHRCSWIGTTADTLLAFPRRYDRVVLDASNVDISGSINSTRIHRSPTPIRLAGGGGAPDVAAAARELVLLHGRTDVSRLVAKVDYVTAASRRTAQLITPWGVLSVGPEPRVMEWLDAEQPDELMKHLSRLGVDTGSARYCSVSEHETSAARRVMIQAAMRGYVVAENFWCPAARGDQ